MELNFNHHSFQRMFLMENYCGEVTLNQLLI